jgi:hypothetical protein
VANQAIALQSRAPQSNFLGPAIQQGAQMVNMMRQREAADLQAAATNQQLEIARAREAREALAAQQESAHDLKIRPLQISAAEATALKGQLENNLAFITLVNNEIKNAKTPEAVIGAAAELKRRYPTQGQYIDRALAGMQTDPAGFEIWRMQSVSQSRDAKDQMANIDIKLGEDGIYYMIEYSPGKKPAAFEIPTHKLDEPQGAQGAQGASARPMAAPAPNPMAPAPNPIATPANARASAPASPMAAAPMPGPNTNPVGGAPLNIQSGNMFQPASMTAGPQMGGAQPNLRDIVNQAMSSGQISGSNLQLMRDAAGPDKSAQLDQLLKTNNIQIVPDAQTDMRSAMLRGGEAEDMLQQTQSREGYTATGQPLRGKPPMQGVYPGSALVPLPRVAAEARAGRETPGEVYAKEMARNRAERDALKSAGPKPLTPVQEAKLRENIGKDYKSAQATLDKMLAPDSGVVAAVTAVRNLSESQKQSITGISSYMPALLPEARSAETALKNLMGKATSLGKSEAALSGAIGNMAIAEWRIVRDLIATLDVAEMEPADLDNQLDIIEATAKRAAQTTRDAYENQYFEEFARYPNRFVLKDPEKIDVTPGKKVESALPRVRTDADFNRLKPGTTFIDAKGERRVKPAQRVQYTPQQMAAVRSIQGGPRGAGGTQTNPTMVMNAQQYARLPIGTWYIDEDGVLDQKGRK